MKVRLVHFFKRIATPDIVWEWDENDPAPPDENLMERCETDVHESYAPMLEAAEAQREVDGQWVTICRSNWKLF